MTMRPFPLVLAVVLFGAAASARAEVCNIKVLTDASPDYSDMPSMIRSITGNWPTTADAVRLCQSLSRSVRSTRKIGLHGRASGIVLSKSTIFLRRRSRSVGRPNSHTTPESYNSGRNCVRTWDCQAPFHIIEQFPVEVSAVPRDYC